jgi:para-nitrobenzyl esterase
MDIPFVFDNLPQARGLIGSVEPAQPLADAMSDAWVSFARDGSPSGRGLPDWAPFDSDARSTMIFDRECRVEQDPDAHLRAIWETL